MLPAGAPTLQIASGGWVLGPQIPATTPPLRIFGKAPARNQDLPKKGGGLNSKLKLICSKSDKRLVERIDASQVKCRQML